MTFYNNLIKLAFEPEHIWIERLEMAYKIKLGKSTLMDIEKIQLAYQIECDNPHMNIYDVNREVQRLLIKRQESLNVLYISDYKPKK